MTDPVARSVDAPIDPSDHLGLVFTIARPFAQWGENVRDSEAYADGLLGLHQGLQSFDPARGVPLGAHLSNHVRWAILSGLRDARRGGPDPLQFSDLGNATVAARPDTTDPDAAAQAASLLGCLGECERRLVERVVMGGMSPGDVGAMEPRPMTGERVKAAVRLALRRMRRAAGKGDED